MFKFVMIVTNIDHHSISVLRKFDGIDYCDFHYHTITIISYCPTLPTRIDKIWAHSGSL